MQIKYKGFTIQEDWTASGPNWNDAAYIYRIIGDKPMEFWHISEAKAYIDCLVKKEGGKIMKLAVLNTSILTTEGTYTLRAITLDEAKSLSSNNEILSAVGHQSTAEVLTELLGVSVPVNRIMFEQKAGQQALVFKLNGRPPEGKILSRDEIEAIGYKFQLLERIE